MERRGGKRADTWQCDLVGGARGGKCSIVHDVNINNREFEGIRYKESCFEQAQVSSFPSSLFDSEGQLHCFCRSEIIS